MTKQQKADLALYREYLKALAKGLKVPQFAEKKGISTRTVYNVIKRIKRGDTGAMEAGRLDGLWQYKYLPRFMILSEQQRTKPIFGELKAIIAEMRKDGFPQTLIAKKVERARSTVIFHLEK